MSACMYRTQRTLALSLDSFNDEHENIEITADDARYMTLGGRVVRFQPMKEME